MIKTEPTYITPDDFFNYWGVSLGEELKGIGYSAKANQFLVRLENRLLTWIDATTFRVTKWEDLTEYQIEQLQYALLEQAMYIFRNGDTALDSGYDPESGLRTAPDIIKSIEVCGPAINHLKNAGLYNHKVTNRYRYTRFD